MLLCEITSVMGVHLSFVIVIFSLALTEVVSLYTLLMFYAFFLSDQESHGGWASWAHCSGGHHIPNPQGSQEIFSSERTTTYE